MPQTHPKYKYHQVTGQAIKVPDQAAEDRLNPQLWGDKQPRLAKPQPPANPELEALTAKFNASWKELSTRHEEMARKYLKLLDEYQVLLDQRQADRLKIEMLTQDAALAKIDAPAPEPAAEAAAPAVEAAPEPAPAEPPKPTRKAAGK